MSDVDTGLAAAIRGILQNGPPEGMTPSAVGKKLRKPYRDVTPGHTIWQSLEWMKERQLVRASGNGAWTRYHYTD